ncbi:hypothetical protein B0187_07990 [Haemophilus paracuniculus]|uniref:Lipoprotein n=1 Tax=Haemophilus paracuniculus TaxID=734 RepID=A0A1T0AQT6_9PAST|nr:hypothetical protein [Haemophilus paracuniculus]OOR98593.1 hypothetical protein B0187_07990 [Haemophilus paracuniculus]
MKKSYYLLFLLGSTLLLGCEKQKVATLEQTKAYYDSLTDSQISENYKNMAKKICLAQIKQLPAQIKDRINIDQSCNCYAENLSNEMGIDMVRLASLPEEGLSSEQKRNIQILTSQLTEKYLPSCLN